jgi:DNA-directed RNA polymerase specialized sigma24 family protein
MDKRPKLRDALAYSVDLKEAAHVPSNSNTQREVLSTIFHEEVRCILRTLSPREEQAILLRMDGASYREIAEEMRLPWEKAKQLVVKSMRQLRSPERARHLRAVYECE